MSKPMPLELQSLVISMQNSSSRLQKVFSFKERIDWKRRTAMTKLRHEFESLNETRIRQFIDKELNQYLFIYPDERNEDVWIHQQQQVRQRQLEELRRLRADAKTSGRMLIPDDLSVVPDYKQSIPRCYRTAVRILDGYIARLKHYLESLPNNEITAEADAVLQAYIKIRNRIDGSSDSIMAYVNMQAKLLSKFREDLSILTFKEFLKYYEREKAVQQEIFEYGRIELAAKVKYWKKIKEAQKAGAEWTSDHQTEIWLFAGCLMAFSIALGYLAPMSVGLFRFSTKFATFNTVKDIFSWLTGNVDFSTWSV